MDKLMRAEAAQRKLKKRVHRHKKAASEARWESDQAYAALGNLHTQMKQVINREQQPKKQELMIKHCLQDCRSSWRPPM